MGSFDAQSALNYATAFSNHLLPIVITLAIATAFLWLMRLVIVLSQHLLYRDWTGYRAAAHVEDMLKEKLKEKPKNEEPPLQDDPAFEKPKHRSMEIGADGESLVDLQ